MRKCFLLVLLSVMLAACSSMIAWAQIDRVDISRSSNVPIGPKGSIKFTAKAYAGDRAVTTAKFIWTCSVGAGKISSTGSYKAYTTPGTYTITATVSGTAVSESSTVQVVPGPAKKLVIDGAVPLSIASAETHTFTAVTTDSYGNQVDAPAAIVFSLSKPKAGEITTDGVFTAGSTPAKYSNVVIAKCGKITGKLSVTVTAPPPTRVQLLEGKSTVGATKDVKAGSKTKFSAVGYDKLDRAIAGLKFRFSADTDCGTVNATTGAFTASKVAGNSGTLSAQALINGATAGAVGSTEITVTPGTASRVVISPQTASVEVGDTCQFSASAADAYGNAIQDGSIVWSVVMAKAGTIDASGLFTGGSTPGKYPSAIMATVGKFKAKAGVTVTPAPPASVELMIGTTDAVASTAEATAGSTYVLSPVALDSHGTTITYLKFQCTTTGSAGTITKGNVYKAATTAGNSGTITIQPTYMGAACGDPFEANVTIVPAVPKTVTMDPANVTAAYDDVSTLTVSKVADAYGNTIDDATITWSISSANGGAVVAGDPTTSATYTAGKMAGTYTVKATATNSFGSAFGTVNAVILNTELASQHLQTLINSDEDIDIVEENTWFTDYHNANPTDPVGTLGLSISKLGKTVYTLAQKYGVAEDKVVQATTFRKTISMVTSDSISQPENIVFDMLGKRGVLSTSNSATQNVASAANIVAASDSITPDQIAADIKNVLIPALNTAITSLSSMVDTDSTIVTLEDSQGNDFTITGNEIRAYRAGLEACLGALSTVSAYNWSCGSFDWNKETYLYDKDSNNFLTPAEYLPTGSFGTLTSTALLSNAWTALNNAVDDADAVVSKVQGQEADPISLLVQMIPSEKWSRAEKALSDAKQFIAGPVNIQYNYRVAPYTEDDTITLTVDPSAFWTDPITDLRKLMPTFSYSVEYNNTYTELNSIPDKTLGGVLPSGATQVPAELWKEWFNFFNHNGDEWWGYFEPWYLEENVPVDADIVLWADKDPHPAAITVRLFKQNMSGGWDAVQINQTSADVQGGRWVFTPAQTLANSSVYRLTATSTYGQVTSYFTTE